MRIEEERGGLRVHALGTGPEVPDRVEELENRVADLFGITAGAASGER